MRHHYDTTVLVRCDIFNFILLRLEQRGLRAALPSAPGTKYNEIANGVASCVEVNPEASEPGFEPPVVRQIAAGRLTLHGFAVCVVTSVGSADV